MSEVIPVAVTEILGENQEKSNIPIAEIREEKEEKKCCCLKDLFTTRILELTIFSSVGFGILYICDYMGIRNGWEGPYEGAPVDHSAKYYNSSVDTVHLNSPVVFGFQFFYLICTLSPYYLYFGRNIFIKHQLDSPESHCS